MDRHALDLGGDPLVAAGLNPNDGGVRASEWDIFGAKFGPWSALAGEPSSSAVAQGTVTAMPGAMLTSSLSNTNR